MFEFDLSNDRTTDLPPHIVFVFARINFFEYIFIHMVDTGFFLLFPHVLEYIYNSLFLFVQFRSVRSMGRGTGVVLIFFLLKSTLSHSFSLISICVKYIYHIFFLLKTTLRIISTERPNERPTASNWFFFARNIF